MNIYALFSFCFNISALSYTYKNICFIFKKKLHNQALGCLILPLRHRGGVGDKRELPAQATGALPPSQSTG